MDESTLIQKLNLKKANEIPDFKWSRLTSPLGSKRIARMLDYEYGERVIEIGPGQGYLAAAICKAKANILRYDAIEIDETLLAQTQSMATMNGLSKIHPFKGDGNHLDTFPKHYYTTAVLAEVLEHVEQPLNLLKQVHHVLAPQSWIILTVPSQGTMPPSIEPEHLQDFSIQDIQNLLSYSGYTLIHHCQSAPWEFYLAIKR